MFNIVSDDIWQIFFGFNLEFTASDDYNDSNQKSFNLISKKYQSVSRPTAND